MPSELQAICEKAMARELPARYPTMREMADDLQRFLDGRVVQAYEQGPLAELRKWILRNRRAALSIAGALLFAFAAVSGAAYFLAQYQTLEATLVKLDALLQVQDLPERFEELRDEGTTNVAVYRDIEARGREVREQLPAYRAELDDLREAALRAGRARVVELTRADGERMEQLTRRREELVGELNQEDLDPGREWDLNERLDGIEADLLGLKRRAAHAGDWVFDDELEQREHDVLERLVTGLDEFVTPGSGFLARIDSLRTLEERSLVKHRGEWEQAIEYVRVNYDGLRIEPIEGLVPLGPDPLSDLYEFWHMESGHRPERDGYGELQPGPETGLVFVLLRGGGFRMGAAWPENATHPDTVVHPLAKEEESRVHWVYLSPFLISKYEMTQGQWLDLTGANPAHYQPRPGRNYTLDQPVENVNWIEAERTLRQNGMRLPTEAQWEYAARSGTNESFPGGSSDPGELARYGNLRVTPDPFRTSTAPVGWFLPNEFGLHDTMGNVFEWCQEPFLEYREPILDRHGTRDGEPDVWWLIRGGGLGSLPESESRLDQEARSTARTKISQRTVIYEIGVRPAMSLSAAGR